MEKAKAVERILQEKAESVEQVQRAKEAAEVRAKEAEVRAACAQQQLLDQGQQLPAMVQSIASCLLRGAGSRGRLESWGVRVNPAPVAIKVEPDEGGGRAITDAGSASSAAARKAVEQASIRGTWRDQDEGLTDGALQELMQQYSQGGGAATPATPATPQPPPPPNTPVDDVATTPAAAVKATAASAAVAVQGLLSAMSGRRERQAQTAEMSRPLAVMGAAEACSEWDRGGEDTAAQAAEQTDAASSDREADGTAGGDAEQAGVDEADGAAGEAEQAAAVSADREAGESAAGGGAEQTDAAGAGQEEEEDGAGDGEAEQADAVLSDEEADGSADGGDQAGACEDDLGCSLNGECRGGRCVCDAAWSGSANCSVLALLPARRGAGYGAVNSSTSSWGAGVVYDPIGKKFVMIEEMDMGCGLQTWNLNSRCVVADSPTVDGAYTFRGVVVDAWAHSCAPARDDPVSGIWVVSHLGAGDANRLHQNATMASRCSASSAGECTAGPGHKEHCTLRQGSAGTLECSVRGCTGGCSAGTTPALGEPRPVVPCSGGDRAFNESVTAGSPYGPWQTSRRLHSGLHGGTAVGVQALLRSVGRARQLSSRRAGPRRTDIESSLSSLQGRMGSRVEAFIPHGDRVDDVGNEDAGENGFLTTATDSETLAHIGYRSDADGLRAVAVLSVIAYHMNTGWLPGGYTGVDIFFVISGNVVIASLLSHPCGSCSEFFCGFYARRVKG
ncbi:unnamed protein product [Prorocentrum cordatum]|uniref:Uncharacterized protein n=1 Tax=Prorocentrum cordatum TaxID=2364126 RepID=A0ABN9X5Z8_9DINO|nr:unnamed protein product [Polarella glacialis]